MPEQFVILCCENIRPEVDAVLATGTMPKAAARSFPFHCGHVRSVWETVKEPVGELENAGDTICLCGCGCQNTFDIPKDVMSRASLALVESGPQLFLPEALLEEFRRCGAYLVLPGWLMRWKQNAERDGLDPSTARQMFGESVSAIVLLDTGLWPDIAPVLAEFAEFCGLPARTFPVGPDHFRFRLAALYHAWEAGEEMKAGRASVRAAEKRIADYSMVADLTARLVGIHDETAAIMQVLDFLVLLFSPEKTGFLPVYATGPGSVLSIPADAYPDQEHFLREVEPSRQYRITGTGGSFLYPIRYNDTLIGILSVDTISLPDSIDEYLNLTHFISQVAGLSVTIARTHQDLVRTVSERDAEIAERKKIAADLLLHSEILQHMAEGVALIRADDGILVFANTRFNQLFGYQEGELHGKNVSVLNAPGQETPEEVAREIEDELQKSGIWEGEVQNISKDGTAFWCSAIVSTYDHPVFGRVWITVHNDITERKRVEDALRLSEEKYRTLVESSFDGIAIHQDGILVYVNRTAARLLGSESPGDFLGKPAIDIVAPACRGGVAGRVQKASGTALDLIREQFLRTDGTTIDVDVTTAPSSWNGRPAAYVTFRDITAQVRAEAALRESEEKYRTIVDEMQDIFYRTDLAGIITMLSPSAARLAGYDSIDQLLGKPVSMVYANPEDRHKLLAALQESGAVYAFPIDLKVRDGSVRHVTTSSHFYRDPQGTIAGVEGVIHDITKLRVAEDALRESEEKFRALVETTSDFIWEVDVTGHYTYVSPQVKGLLEYDPGEIIGRTPFDLMNPSEARRVREEFDRLASSRLPIIALENQCIHRNGHTVVLETSGVPRYGKDGSLAGYRGIDRDITRRKESERALAESEERYRTIIENIQDVYFRIDRENRIGMVSPSAAPTFGYASITDMIGMPILTLWKHPEQRTLFLEAMKNQGGAVQDWEAEFSRNDGSPVWVSISAHLRSGEQGENLGTEGIIRDISGRKKIEEALKSALTKLNMLSSITRHDILNQVTGLRTFLELSREDLKGTKHEMFIEKEDQAAEAIQRQIEFTRYYQDIGVNAPKWQDAGAVIRDAIGQLAAGIDIQVNVSGVEIFADPLIIKVFFNLMENSLRHGERVTQMSFSAGKSVEGLVITYRDNGVGISAEDKKKLFQKGFGKHTGLGLFLSREILAITGITIAEKGEQGKGVLFEITVPYGSVPVSDNNLTDPVSSTGPHRKFWIQASVSHSGTAAMAVAIVTKIPSQKPPRLPQKGT